MNTFSEKIISVEEARTALRCMKLGDLSEDEALECLDEFVFRVRNVTTAKIVEEIIEKELTPLQTEVMKMYLYDNMGVAQIGRVLGLSQAATSKIVVRANNTIVKLMTPLIKYQSDISDAQLVPVKVGKLLDICAARNGNAASFCEELRNLRIAYDIGAEQLSSNLKISKWDLAAIEEGRKIPSITTAMRYSALFDVEIEMKFKNGRGFYSCKRP